MSQAGKETIKIDPSVSTMGCGEQNFISCYRKVVEKVGEHRAMQLYSGMLPEKSAYIMSADHRLDNFSVRWTLDRLKEMADAGYRTRGQVQQANMSRTDGEYYDDDYDAFYGPKDTVTYARWLYNRYGADGVASHFRVSRTFAVVLGNCSLPGGIRVATLGGSEDAIYAMEDRIDDRRAVAFENSDNLERFRRTGSRKLKVRMNRLIDIPEIFVLKRLLEAEEYNITAKDCYYKYVDYNYGMKGSKLREAISKLPSTGWPYWWQRDADGLASYIFYVELPGGTQVSWHGMDMGDMEGVPEDNDREWDGLVASTLPKLVGCIVRVCPPLLEDKFDSKRCRAVLSETFKHKEAEDG